MKDYEVDKYLSDNRDRYIEQSRNTTLGKAAPLPAQPLRRNVHERDNAGECPLPAESTQEGTA